MGRRSPFVVPEPGGDDRPLPARLYTISEVMEMTTWSRNAVVKRFSRAYVGRGIGYNRGLPIFMYDADAVEKIVDGLSRRVCEICRESIAHGRYGQKRCGSGRCEAAAARARKALNAVAVAFTLERVR